MTTLTLTTLSEEIITATRAADARTRSVPCHSRLLSGRATLDEYAAWLIQHYKFVVHTVPMIRGFLEAMAHPAQSDPLHAELYEYAKFSLTEEAGHDFLILMDLQTLWGVGQAEVLGRIEQTQTAPAVAAYGQLVDMLLARYPHGVPGIALAFEILAGSQVDDSYDGLIANSSIPGIEKAVTYLKAHRSEVEDNHSARAAEMVDKLETPRQRGAATFFANMALTMYEGMVFFINDRNPG